MGTQKFDLASVDLVLKTTRSVRKRLDLSRAVPSEIITECIEIALQAPTGSNSQGWRFLVVTDPEKRRGLAELYRRSSELYVKRGTGFSSRGVADLPPDDPRVAQMPPILASGAHLTNHLAEVPVHLIPCVGRRVEHEDVFAQATTYGSILPAVWSLMLALRARGLGSAWTTLHLLHEQDAARLLGIPDNFTQVALLPIAYFKGETFHPAQRLPARRVVFWDAWGAAQ
jgi:nitroreductase